MLLVVYDINSEDVIGRLKEKAKNYGEIKQILPSCFMLDVSENKPQINKDFLDIVSNNGRIIVAKVNRGDVNGWLSTESVEWINSKNF